MLALLPFGLLEVLLVLLAVVLTVGLVVGFGYPGVDNYRSKCPACGTDGLRCVELGLDAHRHRLRVFRCEKCGAAYREAIDNTLVEMPTDS